MTTLDQLAGGNGGNGTAVIPAAPSPPWKPRVTQEAVGQETLARLLAKAGRTVGERAGDGKSAEGKRALAAALQAQTPVTNRWLGEPL